MIECRIEHAFGDWSLQVDFRSEAKMLGLFGPSGAGKSTLLQALAGWIRPDQARIALGERILQDSQASIWLPIEARGIAVVPQAPLLFPHRSVRGNLEYAPGARARLESGAGQRMLRLLRLEGLLERRTTTLSGGEQQRVALGRAYLADPKMILLDEPTASLDSAMAREVMALLLEAKATWDIPMVFVTHRMQELLALADEALWIDGGRVLHQGAPRDVLSRADSVHPWPTRGVENLLSLTVAAHEPEQGLSWVALGGPQDLRLAIPPVAQAVGERVTVALRGEDILLAQADPGPTSARNALPVRLLRLTPVGEEVLVDLELGSQLLTARVTPGAASALRLTPGQALHVLIKTTACLPVIGT